MRTVRVLGLSAAVFLLSNGRLDAQPTSRGVWQVEVYGGAVDPSTPASGTGMLPPNQPLASPNNIRPVPSWYFGDGAFQINQFSTVRRNGPIAPLDSTLQRLISTPQSGGVVGARISRRINGRIAAELSVDYVSGRLELADDARAAFETARGSFVTALVALFPPFFASTTASSTLEVAEGDGGRLITTGTVRVDMLRGRRWTPYATAGLGRSSVRGEGPRAVLTGTYEITLTGLPVPPQPVDQTDILTVSSAIESGMVWVYGAGVTVPLGGKWGVRVDIRDHVQRNTLTTRIETAPMPPTTLRFVSISQFGGNPSLMFSGLSGLPSTLSVALPDFVSFRGSGTTHQLRVSAGATWGF